MKTMQYVFFLVASLFCISLSAQDLIYQKSGVVIEADIQQVSDQDIRYKPFQNPDGPIFILSTTIIDRIVLEDGTVHHFSATIDNEANFEALPKRAIKVGVFSPLFTFFDVSYEHILTPRTSFEATAFLIGLGRDNANRDPLGIGFSAGYKAYLSGRIRDN
jgi:hypothetical protein